ncbi:MAG: MgtC/SapB family protein [Methyloceanibacter sp.]
MDGNLDTLDIFLRLGAAVAAGMLIGLNRDMADKPIGMRTLGLVALGAALASLAVIEVKDLADHPDALSRVVQGAIQGIMAGISFIGAGVILRDRENKTVEGLTTAATVWVTAALGIACGLGAWGIAGVALALSLGLLLAVGWLERITPDASTGGTKPKRRRSD